ncbi:MAG: hypothetical protein J6U25_02680, partial [Clostridia bacterium]|nr:hypothetical protein [Clostridia bacterium]
MNVVEVCEKNLHEALDIYKRERAEFFTALYLTMPDDEKLETEFFGYETGAISYILSDKGRAYALFTTDTDRAEISNLCFDLGSLDKAAITKTLEFAIKQFSAITLVFIWVDSLNQRLSDVLEDFGFEYTGEQNYLDKE